MAVFKINLKRNVHHIHVYLSNHVHPIIFRHNEPYDATLHLLLVNQ